MSNFNSCIFEPPQPISSYFMGVSTSFSYSYYFLDSFRICIFLYVLFFVFFFIFCVGTQKWITITLILFVLRITSGIFFIWAYIWAPLSLPKLTSITCLSLLWVEEILFFFVKTRSFFSFLFWDTVATLVELLRMIFVSWG